MPTLAELGGKVGLEQPRQPTGPVSIKPPGSEEPDAGAIPEDSQFADLIAAQEAERLAREARIREAIGRINSIFGNRSGVFDRFADTSFDLNRGRLTDQRDETARQLKFALGRSGLLGGSVDVDKNATLGDRFNQSLVDARSFADDQAAQLRAQEEAAKAGLIGVASSGNVTGSQIGGLAQGALRATESAARAPAVMPNIGSNFTGLANAIGQALFARGRQQGLGVPGQGQGDGFNSFFPSRGNTREEGTIT